MASYATVAELKVRIQIESVLSAAVTTTYEEILEAISRKIDGFCRRPMGFLAPAVAELRYIGCDGGATIEIPECVEITTVSVKNIYTDTTYVDWTTPTSSNLRDGDWFAYAGSKGNPLFGRTPYRFLQVDPNGDYSYFTKSEGLPTVKLLFRPGYATTTPPTIQEACLAQAAILIKRYESSMDSSLANFDLGVISMKIRQTALTRDVRELLVDAGYVLPLMAGQW